jgi:hypothetical protein
MNNFIGKDGFFWWLGVVEDRNDPLGLNRVRVRMFGHHTDNLQEMPTDSLSWAIPCLTPNGSMTDGTPVIGDYAFGFFTDGASAQAPVIVGVFPGIPKNGPNKSKGFSEGDFYPLGEPTSSRLHRNEKIAQTPIGYHNAHLDTNVPTSNGDSWSEPKSQYNAKIPYNRVTETEAGHVFELDDTPGHERVHLGHKANTFFEIAPDGSKVTKVSGNNYEIYLSDNNVHIKGVCNITVDGDANLYVKGNVIEQVDGDANLYVKGNIREQVDGSYTLNANGPININSQADVVINGQTVNINHGTMGAARVGDFADHGDGGTGGDFDVNSSGTNIIETGSGTVFIGD